MILTHVNDGEGSTEPPCPHSQQVFQLGDTNVNGGRCGEASDQGLREINCHKAKPKKAEGQLLQTGGGQREYGWKWLQQTCRFGGLRRHHNVGMGGTF